MKLFLLTRKGRCHYDEYTSAVVCAPDEVTARNVSPSPAYGTTIDWDNLPWSSPWAKKPEDVIVEYLGEARPGHPFGVICASFNAG